jgi:hypothetical protein
MFPQSQDSFNRGLGGQLFLGQGVGVMGVPPINFGGFSNQSAFQQYQPTKQVANVLGGQEGANQISETLTNESTKQLKVGKPEMMADNTKKETKLAIIVEEGEQLADNRSGGMMMNKGDKQDQTFGDFIDKKDADKEGGDN